MTYIPPNPNGQASSSNSAPVVIASDQSALAVNAQGEVAAGAADSGNPIKVGGKYNAAPPSLSNGQRGDVQLDSSGNLKVTQATLHAGEDLANDVQKVSSKSGILKYQAAPADNVVVSVGPSYLEGIIFGANNGSAQVKVSDHESSGSANVVMQINGDTLLTSASGYMPVNAHFNNGIVCDIVNQTQITFIGW